MQACDWSGTSIGQQNVARVAVTLSGQEAQVVVRLQCGRLV